MTVRNSKGLMFATLFACAGSAYAPTEAERVAAIARADKVFGDTLVAANRPCLPMDRGESKRIMQYAATSFSAVPEEIAFHTLVCTAYELASKELRTHKEEFDDCAKQKESHRKHTEWLSDPTNALMWNLVLRQVAVLDSSGASKSEIGKGLGMITLGLTAQSFMSRTSGGSK